MQQTQIEHSDIREESLALEGKIRWCYIAMGIGLLLILVRHPLADSITPWTVVDAQERYRSSETVAFFADAAQWTGVFIIGASVLKRLLLAIESAVLRLK